MSDMLQEPELVRRITAFTPEEDEAISRLAQLNGVGSNLMVLGIVRKALEGQPGYTFRPGSLDLGDPRLDRDMELFVPGEASVDSEPSRDV